MSASSSPKLEIVVDVDDTWMPAEVPARRATVTAIRPESIARDDVGRTGLVLGGKYRLDRRIATGGMASIWSATHVTLGRPVAVKFVDARMDQDRDSRLTRFMHEAKIAASVRHKNVVDIIDFGVHEEADGTREPYMIMELLEGEPLDLRMRRAPLSPEDAVHVLRQVLSGLDAVHATGIVHRDVKPANVFVTEDADGLFARVIDFGISQDEDAECERVVIGTPEYMSPEQAMGDPVDARCDVYGAGVMLYEMLAGFLPYEDESPQRVLELVVAGQTFPLTASRPELVELSAIVEKAMSRSASERYVSARAMQSALTHATSGRFTPVTDVRRVASEHPTLDAETLETIRPRRRVWPLMLAALGVAAIVVAVGEMTRAQPQPMPAPIAVAPVIAAPAVAPAPPVIAEAVVVEPPVEPVAIAPIETPPPVRVHRRTRARAPDQITRELDF